MVFFTGLLEDLLKGTLSFLDDSENLSKVFLKVLLWFSIFQVLFSFFLSRTLEIFDLFDYLLDHLKLLFAEILATTLQAIISEDVNHLERLIFSRLNLIMRANILFVLLSQIEGSSTHILVRY